MLKKALYVIQFILGGLIGLIGFAFFFMENWKVGTCFILSALVISPLINNLFPIIKVGGAYAKYLIKIGLSVFFFFFSAKFMSKKYYNHTSNNIDAKENVEPKRLTQQELQELLSFQKFWADSVLKVEKGYFVDNKLSGFPDTIFFQLSKEGTEDESRGNGTVNDINKRIYQKDYDSLLTLKYSSKYSSIKTVVELLPDTEQLKNDNEKADRKHLINRQFAGFSGANIYVERYIKENMNDPDSYEHVETTYSDKGTYILVYTKFRGTNALGAKVLQTATAKVDLDGNILSLNY